MTKQNTNSQPLNRHVLHLAAVLIQCLDEDLQDIVGCTASGFIRVENGKNYLYTCWHVVTGFDPSNIQTTNELPNRKYIKVLMQNYQAEVEGISIIGGNRAFTLPLYDFDFDPPMPLWHQEIFDVDCLALNEINLRVPKFYDVIKIELPSDILFSAYQVIYDNQLYLISGSDPLVTVGDKVYVVGFPYGYSFSGLDKPEAITLTRFISSPGANVHVPMLLDSIGAPGMSGAPVFVERNDKIQLFGIYLGSIYPDFSTLRNSANIRPTDLGKVNNLSMVFLNDNSWPLIPQFNYLEH